MRTTLKYTYSILYSHKYLLFSIPLVALITYCALFYYSNSNTLELISEIYSRENEINYKSAILLSQMPYFQESVVLVLFLPFFHLLFSQKLFARSYEITLPVNPRQRFSAYILIAISIYLFNFIIIAILNYLIQWHFQSTYLQVVTDGYEKFGYLYNSLNTESILFNSSATQKILKFSSIFFILLPIYLVGSLYFKKYSLLIFISLIFFLSVISEKIGRMIWVGDFKPINNFSYLTTYSTAILIPIAICFYLAFYNLLKEREA